MQVKWTDEQEKAVYGEKANFLVSAAAGSGKTQVLTGRILNRILNEGVDINRILVVTFTKAAASEMRARIAAGLSEALKNDPENLHLQRQIPLVGAADITTMDAFCLKLIKTYFVDAGVDSSFRIGDSAECKLLRMEAAEEALECLYKAGDEEFLSFADSYASLKNDGVLCEHCLSLYDFASSMPDPIGWIRGKAGMYNIKSGEDFEQSAFAKTIVRFVSEECKALAQTAISLSEIYGELESYKTVFLEDGAALNSLVAKGASWNTLKFSMDDFVWPKRGKEEKSLLQEEAEKARKTLKDQAKKIFGKIQYDADVCAEIMNNSAPYIKSLCHLTEMFISKYSALKKDRNILDYSDLEHLSIDLLSEKTEDGIVPSSVACLVRDMYDEIYIDEYQDSNDVQELLFTLISGESTNRPNMFMVGDMKQSIYAFRKTSPALFIRKNDTYREEGPYRKVNLSYNFRSRKEILSFANHVFGKVMMREIGGIDYTDAERLNFKASYPETDEKCIEFAVFDSKKSDEKRLLDEARLITIKIKEALAKPVYDLKTESYRQAKYSDIAVIMRSARAMAPYLTKACEKEGIPLYCDVGGDFFGTLEVSVFLSLLRTIDNVQDDVPLLSCMRAPFFMFTEDELAQIRLRDRENLYYYAVKKTAEEDTPLGEKCRKFLSDIKRWRRKAAFLPTDTLILTLFEETGYLRFVDGLEGGAAKRANLELLLEKAHRFEETAFRGLFHFLRYVERLSARSESDGEAKLVGGENVVSLMSIHRSKGLEFPVVILSGCGKKFNRKSTIGDFLFHKDLGIGLSFIDGKRRIKYDAPSKAAIVCEKLTEDMGEELRVLYVALTRPKERLIITGAMDFESYDKNMIGGLTHNEILYAENSLLILLKCSKDFEGAVVNKYVFGDFETETKKKTINIDPLPPDENISSVLSYRYENEDLRLLPSKISVTEYKRLREEKDEITLPLYKSGTLKSPRFRKMQGNIKGADFGTLMHFVMERFPYETVRTLPQIREYVMSLVSRNILSEEQGNAVDCEKLFDFWDGEMGHRIRRAEKVFRETPFTQTVPASVLTKNPAHINDRIVIQGIIDCFFFENDGIVLLDYKTDAPCAPRVIVERYKTQLDCYAMALKQKYFSEISQKVIYLFSNNGIIDVKD